MVILVLRDSGKWGFLIGNIFLKELEFYICGIENYLFRIGVFRFWYYKYRVISRIFRFFDWVGLGSGLRIYVFVVGVEEELFWVNFCC